MTVDLAIKFQTDAGWVEFHIWDGGKVFPLRGEPGEPREFERFSDHEMEYTVHYAEFARLYELFKEHGPPCSLKDKVVRYLNLAINLNTQWKKFRITLL